MSIQHRLVEYTDGDTLLEGYLAYDDAISGPRPCVIIAHTWAGRSDFECAQADKLAALGYVGFALDMYGKGVLGSDPSGSHQWRHSRRRQLPRFIFGSG